MMSLSWLKSFSRRLCDFASGEVLDERHHASRHVVEVVTVEGPSAWIVRVERDRYGRHGGNRDRVAHRAANWVAVDADHLKMVPVQMHRVRHHRHIEYGDLDALALTAEVVRALDAPLIARHAADQSDGITPIGRALCWRLRRSEPA